MKLLKNFKSRIALGMLTVGLLFAPATAFMAVDPDVASTTEDLVVLFKDNLLGILDIALPVLIALGLLMWGIWFVWRMFKKVAK